MSTHSTGEIDKKEAEQFLMSLNRKERRRLGKKSGVKIPASNQPFVKQIIKHILHG